MFRSLVGLLLLGCLVQAVPAWSASPEDTIHSAQLCLDEALSNPAKRIPEKMLSDAYAVAVIPKVIKIGFIGAVRRGHGVVLVRDKDGDWGLPQFITITGGSVGWQAGAQSSDVILVFRSQRSVENLRKGDFTLGVDAAVAAGPLGRRVEAATDVSLEADILSYARSRGLFAGVSLDGSSIQGDTFAHQAFYGSDPNQMPRQIPQSASQLVSYVAAITGTKETGHAEDQHLKLLKSQLVRHATQLAVVLDQPWREYLALPSEVFDARLMPSEQSLAASLSRYDTVLRTPAYAPLAKHPDFVATYEVLREFATAIAATRKSSLMALPPPPMLSPTDGRR